MVCDAIEGKSPWTIPNPFFSQSDLAEYLQEFPDHTMEGIGLGDLSIIKEYYHQCKLDQERHILIWTLDGHLEGYEHKKPGWVER